MSDPLYPWLCWSEDALSDPAVSPCEPEDAAQLHMVEGAQIPAWRRNVPIPEGSPAEFLAFFRAQVAADPEILGGLSPHDCGRLLAAQERALDKFNRAAAAEDREHKNNGAREVMAVEYASEKGAPVHG